MAQNSSKKQTIAEPEAIYCDLSKVSCDGDDGALGHPRVYLQMDALGQVECPYCDRLYIKAGGESDKR
jgi:uncharacterized Zn-finger protein